MPYGVYDYGAMMGDSVRMNAYGQALRNAVNSNSVILDLGAGTGIFSILACRYGAQKVYAIEPNDAVQMAKQLAVANGCADRIQFIQEVSTKVDLPEMVDVIISDLRGALPIYSLHIPSIADARNRFLKPGGILLPQKDVLWGAVVEAPEAYQNRTMPWQENHFDLNLQAVQSLLTNTWGKTKIKADQLVTESKSWAILDYRKIEDPNVKGGLNLEVTRDGQGHGLFIWFDATIDHGASFSGGPGAPDEMVYGNSFFPFSKPIEITKGDHFHIDIGAFLAANKYIWQWKTQFYEKHGQSQCKTSFNQSTFFADLLTLDSLHKKASNYIPNLSNDGRLEHAILRFMEQKIPLGEIANYILKDFPNRFKKREEALAYVGERSQRYCS